MKLVVQPPAGKKRTKKPCTYLTSCSNNNNNQIFIGMEANGWSHQIHRHKLHMRIKFMKARPEIGLTVVLGRFFMHINTMSHKKCLLLEIYFQ